MKVKLGKGIPNRRRCSTYKLALGILGCWIDQVTGTKVKIAKAYYSAHFAHYPRNAFVFWGKHHRKFFNSMPVYGEQNAPGNAGLESWRVFSKMYPRTSKTFAQVTQDTARKTYAMVRSIADGKLVPLIDYANHHPTFPNAKRECDSSGCTLVALRKIEEGQEVTVSYGTHSNFDMLARFGFEVGAKDNLRAHGLSLSGCRVHFEQLIDSRGGWDLPRSGSV